jgi:hypothetical protein
MDWSALIGGVIGGVIGVAGGVSATILSNRNSLTISREERDAALILSREERDDALILSREERIDSRRKDAYLELTKAIATTLNPVADYLHDGVGTMPDITFERFVQARGFALFGSARVREMFADVFRALVVFKQQSGTLSERRLQYREVEAAALRLEEEMAREMSPPLKDDPTGRGRFLREPVN